MAFITPDQPLPALRRSLEAVPIEEGGKAAFLLRDLEELTEKGLALSPGGMALAALLDGRRTAADIRGLFAKATGHFLKPEEILDLVGQLDAALMLETPATAHKRQSVLKAFLESPLRKSVYAGLAYPKEPLELGAALGRCFKDPKGPGKEPSADPLAAPPLGLVSPHIDLSRGGPAYAWSYQALSESRPPDLIVALGVAHLSPNSPWVMTQKTYETPYGEMKVDQGLYDDIRAALWYEPRDEEWVHRTEHSLEFQALWLRYLWRDKTPPWVPILCSSFDRFCPDRPPSSVPTVEGAIASVGARLAARAKAGARILVLCAVDLAHVGPRFGDESEITPELEKKIEAEDRLGLEHAMKLDADAFYMATVADGHWRKVCGLSALYTGLRLIKALSDGSGVCGRLLTYGQAPDPAGGIVSFAGAVFPSAASSAASRGPSRA